MGATWRAEGRRHRRPPPTGHPPAERCVCTRVSGDAGRRTHRALVVVPLLSRESPASSRPAARRSSVPQPHTDSSPQVDGGRSGIFNDNSCTHTGTHSIKHLTVDLGAVYEIDMCVAAASRAFASGSLRRPFSIGVCFFCRFFFRVLWSNRLVAVAQVSAVWAHRLLPEPHEWHGALRLYVGRPGAGAGDMCPERGFAQS